MKQINGYENLYSATEDGEIYSHRLQRVVTGDLNSAGYKRVILCKDKERKRFFVHRLIASTFIENTENKRTVNHKNGNKTDNSVHNLEWATDSEQHLHSWSNGLEKMTPNHIQNKNRKIPQSEILRLKELKKAGLLKAKDEAMAFNVTIAAIYNSIYRSEK